ncbi:MAG: fucose pyrophosphorylase domain-containing protein [Planctomycetota bacterium]
MSEEIRRPTAGRGAPGSPLDWLAHGWALLDLSVETPERVPGWDAVVLTAASEEQARLYELQLDAARRRGRIAPGTLAIVAPDPGGRRIGSGGATLNAIRTLAAAAPDRDVARMRVLLIHAGGDSRRMPWANIIGKPFVPFPLLADADRAAPTLFDHLLAASAPVALAMEKGGILALAGDVLPIFPGGGLRLPADGAVMVTTLVSLDVAERHGVVVAGEGGRVERLMQKASADELARAGALVEGGAALLDTGICLFLGSACAKLCGLAIDGDGIVAGLVEAGEEWSLYEEIVSALVPAKAEQLAARPMGARLLEGLAGEELFHRRADELVFVHLGSTAEVLGHLAAAWQGRLARRVLSRHGAGVADSAVVSASELAAGAHIGAGSLVHASRLGDGAWIGNRCVVLGVDASRARFSLRANSCLWRVPLAAGRGVVTVVCGADDNPKEPLASATFCNRGLERWMAERGVAAEDLWRQGEERTTWTARLYPASRDAGDFAFVEWMLAEGEPDPEIGRRWRGSGRESLASLHASADAVSLLKSMGGAAGRMALAGVREALEGGLDRNVRALGEEVGLAGLRKEAASLIGRGGGTGRAHVPASRLLQAGADLLWTAGREEAAATVEEEALAAVQAEVGLAVSGRRADPVEGLPPGKRERVELPVRFDFAGGWSDTPPYCLERPAAVLNFALSLGGELPIGAEVEALDPGDRPAWEMVLGAPGEAGARRAVVHDPAEGAGEGLGDPFLLPRTALAVAGYCSAGRITQGVRVRTWSRVPRGSGMGASSIIGAALIRALERLAGREGDERSVSELVLVLEQRMTTGGGWQDQVGGLVPGVKYASSAPVVPMRVRVERVPLLDEVSRELHGRFVLAFTGQERLAKNVLQMVVRRYLQRDAVALGSLARLVELAGEGRRALARGDLDGLGAVMDEAWRVHQRLDPHCSNPGVDEVFRAVDDLSAGGKLAGAGGGGFIGIMAKDAEAAHRVREILSRFGRGVSVHDWRLWEG